MSYLPTFDEQVHVQDFVKRLKRDLEGYYRQNLLEVKLHAVGSTAKGTFVSGEHDVDIYVMTEEPQRAYDLTSQKYSTGKKKMGELLIWHFIADAFDVDLVFARSGWVKEDTLRHAPFFKIALSPSQKEEVVKAKAFFKTKGVYSAEVGGITGVAIEELIRINESFEELCKYLAQQDFKPFLQDPVMDEPRDLLASITPRRWKQIQSACQDYLRTRAFTYQVFSRGRFLSHYRDYSIIRVKRKFDKGTDFNTANSLSQHVKSHLLSWEPDVACDYDVYLDDKEILVAVKVTPETLASTTERCVSKTFEIGVEGFKKIHLDYYEKNGYVCAIVQRKVTQPLRFYVETLKNRFKQRGFTE